MTTNNIEPMRPRIGRREPIIRQSDRKRSRANRDETMRRRMVRSIKTTQAAVTS